MAFPPTPTDRLSCSNLMSKNEINRALIGTFLHIKAKLRQGNLVRIVRWHCPLDKGFEIKTLEVWGRAGYLSGTQAPHNTFTSFYEWMGKKTVVSFKPPRPGNESWTLTCKAAVLTTNLGPPPKWSQLVQNFPKDGRRALLITKSSKMLNNSSTQLCVQTRASKLDILSLPLGTRSCCDVESTSMTLIQPRNNIVCPVGN